MHRTSLSSVLIAATYALWVGVPPSSATTCANPTCQRDPSCNTVAVPAPPNLWGAIEPLDLGPLPLSRDQSGWAQDGNYHSGEHPFWLDVDTEGAFVFVAHNTGLQIWGHTGDAAFPQLGSIHLADVPEVQFCSIPELKYPIGAVAVPIGDADVAVLGAQQCEMGLLVLDVSNKAAPTFKYQADGADLRGVWSTVDGSPRAVAAFAEGGLHVYDLGAARSLATPCVEATPGDNGCGVYLGRLGTMDALRGVHGSGHRVAAAGERFEVFDLTDPATPRVSFDPGVVGFNVAVGMFELGASTYLAGIHALAGPGNQLELSLWDISSCLGSGCVGTPPLAAGPLVLPGDSANVHLTTSVRAGRPQLYVGTSATCPGTQQAEWLFEVTAEAPGVLLDEVQVGADYWRWYYATNPDGTFDVRPRRAAFLGDTLYRAGWSILDAHRSLASQIFSDGFDTGSTGQWSAVSP